MSKVVVVGGGASGMSAAISAADNGNKVHIYEKNEKLGKKLFVTGKGRCNITNASDRENHFKNIVANSKFLYSAYNRFFYEDIVDIINGAGVETKIERGNRVFPASDKSSDVINALKKILADKGVKIHLNSNVKNIEVENNSVKGIMVENKGFVSADSVIIATGGMSYPLTGSTGDGYKFCKKVGHTVTGLYPSLVPLKVYEVETCRNLQGLSLKNVEITIENKGKELYNDFGEMMFTHFGITGPIILSASSYITDKIKTEKPELTIDLKPALSYEQLDKRILKDFKEFNNKDFKNSLYDLLPKKLVPIVVKNSGIDPDKKVRDITKEERGGLVKAIKNMRFTIFGTLNFNEAIITKGGVSVSEINPKTMESKLISGLYICGEVLDLDAVTGGYNLQIAWSTGFTAGNSIQA